MKHLTWEQYFLALVQIISLRSKDNNTKVGAIIVDKENVIISTGYNGMPKGDDTFSWKREDNKISNTKYPYVIHAEMNAVLNSIKSVKEAVIYVSLFPCSQCAKLLSQAGIKEVIYVDDKYEDTEDSKISKQILKKCKVKFRQGPKMNVSIVQD